MAHPTRWYCRACGRELGTIDGDKLAVAEGCRVVATPRGVEVTCPIAACRTVRFWQARLAA